MLTNYLKIAWRNLLRYKMYSLINVGGMAMGLAVAILIGLWLYDELAFDSYHENYGRIAQVMRNQTVNGEVLTAPSAPIPLATELRAAHSDDFRRVVLSWWTSRHALAADDQVFSRTGKFMEPEAPDLLSLRMIQGSRQGLRDPASILLSQSLARALFGKQDPMNKVLKIDDTMTVRVTGVYEDLPDNSSFADVHFIAPWDLYAGATGWIAEARDSWQNTSFELFVEMTPEATAVQASKKISGLLAQKYADAQAVNPELFLHPMPRWHLHSEWVNGANEGGRIRYVWLFGGIGLFVLLLACISFINLSTARSLTRAKEVGIRKAIGSVRGQLIGQFLGESLLLVGLAYVLAVVLALMTTPFFNQIADKNLVFPWSSVLFWLVSGGFAASVGLAAGLYPAVYLSSFQSVSVLTGSGSGVPSRYALFSPRQALVVVQFSVSIILIIGTTVVFRQIQYAKNRPIGYSREGLVTMLMNSPKFNQHQEAIRDELIKSGAILNMAQSKSPATEVRSSNGGFSWPGKDPGLQTDFATTGISHDFGQTVGWQFTKGRDFSRQLASDSLGMVISESAAKFMGLRDPIGKTIRWTGEGFDLSFQVLGVIQDMVMDSPYDPVKPSVFFIAPRAGQFLTLRLNPQQDPHTSLAAIEQVFKKFLPEAPFAYNFVDEEFEQKFRSEVRISQLGGLFAGLAILLSCLGLFGLATFTAQQRTKEIGVRKVLGASVAGLVVLLARDFLKLVFIAIAVGMPVAWYIMRGWLADYSYKVDMAWWYFAGAGLLALSIALLTVSFQAVKAALMNPVKSLRSE